MVHATDTGTAALEQLAAGLDPRQYAAAFIRKSGPPCLRVTSRTAPQLSEDIYAGRGWFWWSWAERLAGLGDPAAAAAKVARVLRATGAAPMS